MITDGKEKVMVDINACSPLYLFKSLKSLLTLMTLIILASCGPTLITFREFADMLAMTISKKLAETTKKSNLFHAELK